MGQDSGQMCCETFVHGKYPLRLYCFDEAIKGRRVQISSLVIHAAHDCVWWVHDAAHDESRRCTASKMKHGSVLDTEMFCQTSLCKEVCWQLNGAAKSCADHGGQDTSVQALDAFVSIDLRHAIHGAFVFMLCSDR